MSVVLETKSLVKRFGALVVADHINFQLRVGARHALIGPNGAGKTSFVNMLSGRLRPSSGSVLFCNQDVTSRSEVARARLGLGRTFQINMLFRNLSVLENVSLSVAERRGLAGRMWRSAVSYRDVREEALDVLGSLGIADDAGVRVLDLPYGKQRLVEIAIALGMKPTVLLLDEPAAGVPSAESSRILKVLDTLPSHIAVLIIDHDMDFVFRFAQQITVLVQGQILCEGPPAIIANDPQVHRVYLGEAQRA